MEDARDMLVKTVLAHVAGYGSSKTSHHNASDTDHTQLFAQMIARTGKDIEVLIDSLPGEESTAELQAEWAMGSDS